MSGEVERARAAVLEFALASLRGDSNSPVEEYAAELVDALIAAVTADRDRLAGELDRATALAEARQRVIERMAREELAKETPDTVRRPRRPSMPA